VCFPVIPATRRLMQEHHKFKASLGKIVRPCLKKDKKKRKIAGDVTTNTMEIFFDKLKT
jgi:hypothetical protein